MKKRIGIGFILVFIAFIGYGQDVIIDKQNLSYTLSDYIDKSFKEVSDVIEKKLKLEGVPCVVEADKKIITGKADYNYTTSMARKAKVSFKFQISFEDDKSYTIKLSNFHSEDFLINQSIVKRSKRFIKKSKNVITSLNTYLIKDSL
jgi:hypothetical protein